MSEELLAVADELYGLPLGEFTAARDERARAHRGTDLATRIKGLRKPTTAAWVVDLLVRREPDQVDQLLNVGAALREAQQAMSSGELRNLTRQRRQVTAAVAQQARRHAGDEGLRVTRAVADQVEATLTAAMVDAECGRAVRSGLLVAPLATTGVEPVAEAEVAAAVALPEALGFTASSREAAPAPRPDLHVVPDPDAEEKKRSRARERLEDATAAHEEATAAHAEAEADVERLNARELQLQAEIDELRRTIAGLEDELEEVDDELADAQEVRDEASAALRTADAERDAAAAAVDRLG
ncbi:hypothetical protein KUV85_03050 [Nocardioides panacisoli]|uniref:hypothetical protein n=1 Tax=Nocardioides panacisoli TaxID=627624 RepID=UPI001C62FD22|nr:hypothetical protein [Nocardioides panacisoli]QYJ04674.1 hypothetical protein KUV85_03050 [Nocardioides panacisoli]